MDALDNLMMRLRYDLITKLVLSLACVWVAVLFRDSLPLVALLMGVCLLNVFLSRNLYKRSEEIAALIDDARQQPWLVGHDIERIFGRLMWNLASTNWVLLVVFVLLYADKSGLDLASFSAKQVSVLASFGLLASGLSYLTAYWILWKSALFFETASKAEAHVFIPLTKPPFVNLLVLRYLVVVMMVGLMSYFFV